MQTSDFDFNLLGELIAQHPAAKRDESRLLVLRRSSGRATHKKFRDVLEFLRAGDVLVLNNSRVIPARLRGVNARTGGQFEILLLEENSTNDWWAMARPGKRARVGTKIQIALRNQTPIANPPSTIFATVLETNEDGHRHLHFEGTKNILGELDALGEIPLPPYIRRGSPISESAELDGSDHERYQTVFAHPPGSVAAPTAGLHFTDELLNEIRSRGVQVCFVTLHVGLGTFAPVKAETISEHRMHEERFEVSDETARIVNAAKCENRRVFAVGTTSVRVLESVAQHDHTIPPGSGRTRIFIHPPHEFKIVDALITNFHLPRSTLLMLVSAFAAPGETRGREMILSAYAEAVRERYRFFSYGDAMLIL